MSEQHGEDDTAPDILEIMEAEVYVDVARIRELSRQGVPPALRGAVWKYLLGVSVADKSDEVTHTRQQRERYESYRANRTGSAAVASPHLLDVMLLCGRAYPILYSNVAARKRVESVLFHFADRFDNRYPVFRQSLIHLICPLSSVLTHEEDLYYCFRALLRITEPLFRVEELRRVLSTFTLLMWHILPELYVHLEEMDVNPNQWVMDWLVTLLAKNLPLDSVLRLWDTYLALEDPAMVRSLHLYVCLALLRQQEEHLMSLDGPEAQVFLQSLSTVSDLPSVIRAAFNIREEVKSLQLLKEGS